MSKSLGAPNLRTSRPPAGLPEAPEVRAAPPVFRNIGLADLQRFRWPMAAVVSIMHRLSGVFLFFVGLPFLLRMLQNTLGSESGFEVYRSWFQQGWVKVVFFALLWAYMHHFCAGIRFLLLDVHIGGRKPVAQFSAKVVLAVSLILTWILFCLMSP